MKVFYRAEQAARNTGAFAPSADKPRLVMADWLKQGLISRLDILSFEPVSREDFKLAHDSSFVDGVLDLIRPNGFSNRDAEVAASLPYTTGSLLAAARYALKHKTSVCSPTSGFHHAHYDQPEGFCTFNGLMVVALKLKREGLVNRVAIIDCDVHYGDGTDDLICHHKIDWIQHYTLGRHFHDRDGVGKDAKHFLTWLYKAIADCQDADLVIYQAGADPHINDPLGGVLTELEMVQRDHAVFAGFRDRPLVWNLAGGYQRDAEGGIKPVLKLHRNTLSALQAVELGHP
ncbi:hypothetical protein LNV09_20605 [Paucibacter sp. B2R-40]|uniref:hypothetical protein n=1 Tax=Paucibacter sp. B2R-40 TaxID=2893554 RepID=UPI0021E492A5|nr:hypothetical protein [Paucibacter sp. B2R-40]MCV2356549.1 hypothetical protein [Paucibacter sp. B2R-40]